MLYCWTLRLWHYSCYNGHSCLCLCVLVKIILEDSKLPWKRLYQFTVLLTVHEGVLFWGTLSRFPCAIPEIRCSRSGIVYFLKLPDDSDDQWFWNHCLGLLTSCLGWIPVNYKGIINTFICISVLGCYLWLLPSMKTPKGSAAAVAGASVRAGQ